jgi:hypothetical protein
MQNAVPECTLGWQQSFRIIPSQFPPINFFENLVDPDLMEAAFFIESLTNDRLRHEIGNIALVAPEDRVSGEGSSVIMAAFTHISMDRPSRFSDGSYGVYYASKTLDTAIRETVDHRERFLRYTNEPACELTLRVYKNKKISKPLKDIRSVEYLLLHDPINYTPAQQFGKTLKETKAWGIVYNSVRHPGGECIALLRPPAIPLPVLQTKHLRYLWNGEKIDKIYEISNEVTEL